MELKTALLSFFKVSLGFDLSRGVYVDRFESSLSEVMEQPVITLPNARYGLKMTLEFLKISAGDGVIMSPINLPDMKTVILNTGADLRFISYKEKSFELDFKSIEVKDTDKIFFYTPLAGITDDLKRIKEFCEKNHLILVIDFTQSFLTKSHNREVHKYSNYSFSSLCDLKVIHTHRGGFYTSSDQGMINFLKEKEENLNPINKRFMLMAIIEDAVSLTLLKPVVFRYMTRWVLKILSLKKGDNVEAITSGEGIKFLGFRFLKGFFQSNQVRTGEDFPSFLRYQYTDFQAKIGLNRLRKFRRIEDLRISRAELFYASLEGDALSGIPKGALKKGHTYWKTPYWVDDPKDFKRYMSKYGVDCSQTNLPYLNTSEILNFESLGNMRDNIVYMPTHWYLNDNQVIRMAKIINQYFINYG